MKVIIYDTWERQAQGLQNRRPIEDETIFVFPLVEEGMLFHSQNVTEPFDIVFIARDRTVLTHHTITPELETVLAPPGSFMAIESKAGYLSRIGFLPGRKANF